MSCLKFKKIQRTFLQEKVFFILNLVQEFCWEFDVKIGEVYFDLVQYN
jgi:hypothetical protein